MRRVPAPVTRRPALALALAVFAVVAPALTLTQGATPLPLPRAAAIQAALHSPLTRQSLSGQRWNQLVVSPVDARLARVTFFQHGQVAAQVAVRRDGTVIDSERFAGRAVPYGDWIAYQPALLIGLAALFVLVAGVAPWRRLRNLDVVAAVSLTVPVVLLQKRYVDASMLAALPGLAYLMVRCLARGVGSARAPAPAVPLLDVLTKGWDPARRVRVLRILVAALALTFVMVTLSSREAVDVVYAVMEGGTKLIGGVLPYGHMPGDVIHGDTYPLLSFILYAPLAWASPVHSTWSPVDLALAVAVLAALAVGWALFRAGAGPRLGRSPEREYAGLRAAVAWLAFPPVLVAVSSGTTDVVLAVMLLGAVLLWRRPGSAAGMLAAAAWFKLAPLVLLPVRLASLRGRALVRAVLAVVLVSVPLLAVLVTVGGLGGPAAMVHAVSFQFSRGSPQSLWSALGIGALQPLGEAAVLALLAGVVVQLHRRPGFEDDGGRMAALAAGLLIALQLVANYWAFLYLLWVVPLIGVSLLSERESPASVPVPAGRPATSAQPSVVGVR